MDEVFLAAMVGLGFDALATTLVDFADDFGEGLVFWWVACQKSNTEEQRQLTSSLARDALPATDSLTRPLGPKVLRQRR